MIVGRRAQVEKSGNLYHINI